MSTSTSARRSTSEGDQARIAGKHILIYSLYYGPENTGSAPYTTDVAEALAISGARVTVVTTSPHYPQWRRWREYSAGWSKEYRGEVRVIRVPCYVPQHPTLVRRFLYELSFMLSAWPASLALRIDLVIGTSPGVFVALTAAASARLRRVPLVQLVQDVVSLAPAQTGQGSETGLASRLLRKLELSALGRAGFVTVPTDAFRSSLTSIGLSNEAIRVIPNWSRVKPEPVDRESTRRRLGWSGKFVVLHTGNVGQKQALHDLAPAIAFLEKSQPDAHFVFMGTGNAIAQLRNAMSGLNNVTIADPVPNEHYYSHLAAADTLLVHERDTVRDVSLPSKLTSYFASGRPVLAVTHPLSATALELAKADAGITVRHDNGPRLDCALGELRRNIARSEQLGSNGKLYWRNSLAQDVQLGRVIDLVAQIVDRKTEGRA